jgi:hypothetical protein
MLMQQFSNNDQHLFVAAITIHVHKQEWHARMHTHTHTVTLLPSLWPLLPLWQYWQLKIEAYLICNVYVLQLISLHISQATQVHHITVNGGAFSAAFLYTRP